ncbi:MAG: hypothetical protein M3Z03_04880, partial [Actinomycetota bacterium]|nr:hypothetical protein [Actinomycetota bacterium]
PAPAPPAAPRLRAPQEPEPDLVRPIQRDDRRVVVATDASYEAAELAPVLEGRFGARREPAPTRDRRDPRSTRQHPGTRRNGNHRVRIERDMAVVPQAMRQQRSNVALAVVAVAAVALVAFAGSSLVSSRSGGGSAQEALDAENTAFRADSLAAGSNDPAAQAVFTWVDQLASGDTEAAWTALGPASQEAIGGQQAFDDQFETFAEGYGAWSGVTPEALLVTPLDASDDGTVSIVTLIGSAGGSPRADAIPVRVTRGVATIEAFADAGQIGLEEPGSSDGAEVAVDAELAVLVPDDVVPVIRLDQGPTQRCGDADGTELVDAGDGHQRCTYTPSGGMQPGGRVLTVAFTSPDGPEVSARSVRFNAA